MDDFLMLLYKITNNFMAVDLDDVMRHPTNRITNRQGGQIPPP